MRAQARGASPLGWSYSLRYKNEIPRLRFIDRRQGGVRTLQLPLDSQQVFRQRTDASQCLWQHACGQVDSGLGVAADIGALD